MLFSKNGEYTNDRLILVAECLTTRERMGQAHYWNFERIIIDSDPEVVINSNVGKIDVPKGDIKQLNSENRRKLMYVL